MSCSSASVSEEGKDEFHQYEIPKNNLKFFTYDEVVIHNIPEDFWVVINNIVFNLTPMIKNRAFSMNANIKYLLAFGGKDLSHFFDEGGCPRTVVSGVTGRKIPIFGPVIEHANTNAKQDSTAIDTYWWEVETYQVGSLTRQERPIRIINTLTGKTHKLKVCEEDTIYDIQTKYRDLYNHHAGSYIWRKDYKNGLTSGTLHLNKTLTQNGLFHPKNGIGPVPALWLFYADNFTIG